MKELQKWKDDAEAWAKESGLTAVPSIEIWTADEAPEVDYWGVPWAKPYEKLLEALGSEKVAPALVAIRLRGPDEGANGTRHWQLERLAAGPGRFDRLTTFSVDHTKASDHNQSILCRKESDYEEAGITAQLLAKMPALESLSVPSAPNAAFFDRGPHGLRHLDVQAGYDTQGFIERLAYSRCFPALETLQFEDYAQTSMDDFELRRTPPEHYFTLFETEGLPALRRLCLLKTRLKESDPGALRQRPLGRQLDLLSLCWRTGSRVFARWTDGYRYPATIESLDAGGFGLLYDDGSRGPGAPEDLEPLVIKAGDRFECRWKGEPTYWPAEVIDSEGTPHVRYEDGTEEWLSEGFFRKPPA